MSPFSLSNPLYSILSLLIFVAVLFVHSHLKHRSFPPGKLNYSYAMEKLISRSLPLAHYRKWASVLQLFQSHSGRAESEAEVRSDLHSRPASSHDHPRPR